MTRETPLISFDPGFPGGTPVFAGTTVPVSKLLDHLADGHNIAEFLDDFPAVSESQARTVVMLAREALGTILRHPERLKGDGDRGA
jgi:uncharacterized protein (DUF433 family)